MGKLADFVIMSKNPLKIGTDELNTIEVVTTIVRDKVVYGSYPKAEE